MKNGPQKSPTLPERCEQLFLTTAHQQPSLKFKNRTIYGTRDGFPVSITWVHTATGTDPFFHSETPESISLLIQVIFRGVCLKDRLESHLQLLGPRIEERLCLGKARLRFDDNSAWLSLYHADDVFTDPGLIEVLDAFVEALRSAGFAPSDQCESCKKPLPSPTYDEGRILMLCDDCSTTRRKLQAINNRSTPSSVLALWLLAPIGALSAATLWGLTRIAFAWLITRLLGPRDKLIIPVPHVAEVLLLLFLGAAEGFSASWLIAKVPGRGRFAGRIAASLAVLSGAVFGEAIYAAWLLYREFGVFSIRTGFRILPTLWWEDGIHSIFRIIVVVFALLMAIDMSKPKLWPSNKV